MILGGEGRCKTKGKGEEREDRVVVHRCSLLRCAPTSYLVYLFLAKLVGALGPWIAMVERSYSLAARTSER